MGKLELWHKYAIAEIVRKECEWKRLICNEGSSGKVEYAIALKVYYPEE